MDISARVTHRLLGLRGLPFPMADEMVGKAQKALIAANHRDNALLPLDSRFRQKMESPEDAVAYYFAGNGEKEKALNYLRQSVKRDGDKVYWKASSAWGGNLEVTADAARVMFDAGDELFRPAFATVTGRLVNGILYSTADTRALVELLASLRFDAATRAVIDGTEVSLADISTGSEVTALSNNLIVRLDEEIEINHLEPRADFQFAVKPSSSDLRVGERMQITITPKEQSIAPLARLFLPGNVALLKGGANVQTAYFGDPKTWTVTLEYRY